MSSRLPLSPLFILPLLHACAAANPEGDGPASNGSLQPFAGQLNPDPNGGAQGGSGSTPFNPNTGGSQSSNPLPGTNGNPNGDGNVNGNGNSGAGPGNVGSGDPGSSGSGGTAPNTGNEGGTGGGEPNDPGDGPGEEEPGGFVSVDVNGGASAAFVCPESASFGNPLANMGAVQSVGAPAGDFLAFIEGPVWIGSQNRLYFSDNARDPERLYQSAPPFTSTSLAMQDSGSNGLAVDNQDQLVLADERQRRITRVNPATFQVTEVILPPSNYTPNDLIVRSDDNLYFTDPNTGGRGFYRLSPGGELSGPFTQANAPNAPNSPNGIVLSPDENTLYIGDVNQSFVSSFRLFADGSVDTASGQIFVRTMGGTVDGMAVDCAGNLYVGTANGVEVYQPNAQYLGTVPTGYSSNATFGGPDRRTLFVTSQGTLKFVTLGVPGLPN